MFSSFSFWDHLLFKSWFWLILHCLQAVFFTLPEDKLVVPDLTTRASEYCWWSLLGNSLKGYFMCSAVCLWNPKTRFASKPRGPQIDSLDKGVALKFDLCFHSSTADQFQNRWGKSKRESRNFEMLKYLSGYWDIPVNISNHIHFKLWMKLLIHSQTLMAVSLKCGNR